MKEKKILIFETTPADKKDLVEVFETLNHHVVTVADPVALVEKLDGNAWDLVVIGACPPLADALTLLERITARHPLVPVIMATAGADPQTAVQAMKAGATDFFVKPIQINMVKNIVWSRVAIQPKPDQRGADRFAIVTRDPGMKHLLASARKICDSQAPILIHGESGTGKELFARYVHSCSHRRDKSFVAVNCAALPESLLESELFGHEKGTFTGAVAQKKGNLNRQTVGPCCWMRSVKWIILSRQNCCECFRSGRWIGSAGPAPFLWMSKYWPPPIGTWIQ